jgi:hypothetical protein
MNTEILNSTCHGNNDIFVVNGGTICVKNAYLKTKQGPETDLYENMGYGEYFGESQIFKASGTSYLGNIYAAGGVKDSD